MQKQDSLEAIRKIDLVDYLELLSFMPSKVRAPDYWYLSPLRTEKTASFKVNRTINCWYDHGIGKGGDLIKFGMLYFSCSFSEFTAKFATGDWHIFKPLMTISNSSATTPPDIRIDLVTELKHLSLLGYLHSRHIPLNIALHFCKELHYSVGEKACYGIGFKNDGHGWELRSSLFKGSISPKGSTVIKNGASKLAVFEGFFDFLSWLTIYPSQERYLWDFFILNSLSFTQDLDAIAFRYDAIHLFLDNDTAGQNCSQKLLASDTRYVDESPLYKGYKDLNDWLVNFGKRPLT